jgi:hypothetical protein
VPSTRSLWHYVLIDNPGCPLALIADRCSPVCQAGCRRSLSGRALHSLPFNPGSLPALGRRPMLSCFSGRLSTYLSLPRAHHAGPAQSLGHGAPRAARPWRRGLRKPPCPQERKGPPSMSALTAWLSGGRGSSGAFSSRERRSAALVWRGPFQRWLSTRVNARHRRKDWLPSFLRAAVGLAQRVTGYRVPLQT